MQLLSTAFAAEELKKMTQLPAPSHQRSRPHFLLLFFRTWRQRRRVKANEDDCAGEKEQDVIENVKENDDDIANNVDENDDE